MRGGERRENGEDGCAGFSQPLDRVMARRHQRARNTKILRDVEIVERIADEEDFVGRDAEPCDEIPPERDLAVRVDIIETGNMIELGREAEVGDDFVERFMPVGGQD